MLKIATTKFVDINCDMGEGMPNDEALMPFISSANIACGYHAGKEQTIKTTVELAIKNNVTIGAHPGFKDKENFGRVEVQLSFNEIYNLVADQIKLLQEICKEHNLKLRHVKPHGALYNMASKDPLFAAPIAKAVFDCDKNLLLYGLNKSCLVSEGKRIGLKTLNEVFADRTYQDDGSLTPRSHPNALITKVDSSVKQVLQIVQYQRVTTASGKVISINADTICIHGDGEHALKFAKEIHKQLHQHNIEVRSPK